MKPLPYIAVRKSATRELYGFALPDSSVLSLPVIARREGRIYDAHFAYHHNNEFSRELTRPFAWFLLPVDGKEDIMFSHCRVMDFVSTDAYPLDSVVSDDLPKAVDAREYADKQKKYLELYDQIRSFVFEENLNRDQVSIVVSYKQLFLELCYEGHYPFYHALSTAFFHWLRLPLPTLKETPVPKDLGDTREYQYQLLILENLQQLVRQFQDKIHTDTHKQQLFDEMHEELQEYKNGMLDTLTQSLELDIITLVDNVQKTVKSFAQKENSQETCDRLLELFKGVETDLRDLLYRHGVDPFTLPGSTPEVSRQKIISTVITDNPKEDRLIAERLSPGWEKKGKMIRPEHVSVYLYQPHETNE